MISRSSGVIFFPLKASMSLQIFLLLFGAGLMGGVANSIAGGATLITFPTMLFAGLPPIIANASNSVAVTPGQLIAAVSDRKSIPSLDRAFGAMMLSAFLGGAAGSFLLLITPEKLFILFVPALIGVATLIFAFSANIRAAASRWQGGDGSSLPSTATASILVGVTSIYGGYFGAGIGVMLMAVLSICMKQELRVTNAAKNLLSTFVSLATILIFVSLGLVSWPETLVMASGAAIGGYIGGRLIRVLPAPVVRKVIIAIGTMMTLVYAYRYWL